MRLKKLSLTNYRQFKSKEIAFQKDWTVIAAPNASGKSTIIEAIYMLSTGESPWSNSHGDMIRIIPKIEDPKPSAAPKNTALDKIQTSNCRIEGQVENADELHTLALFVQRNHVSTTKQFKIEGNPTTRNKFTQYLHCILFSPDMIDLLMFEPKQRRDFLDTNIRQFDPDYNHILLNYQKVLRQRNSLLKQLAAYNAKLRNGGNSSNSNKPDPSSLNYWTEQLLDLGAQIIKARLDFFEELNSTNKDLYPTEITYLPKVRLHDIESLGDIGYFRELFEKQLAASHKKESVIGTTTVGPHRDDWHLSDSDRNLNTLGSRGEKRMAIADVILKMNSMLSDHLGEKPLLLLDDVASELDADNLKLLFEKKIDVDQQVIITTTDQGTIPMKKQDLIEVVELG